MKTPLHRANRILSPLGTVLIVAACAHSACAIEIDDVIWGFDGHATRNAFNPVSVRVSNRSSETFDGGLELTESLGGGRVGAILREELFLTPDSSRWVQFYPVVKQRWDWSVRWGQRGNEKFDLPRPRLGEQLPIQLVDPDNVALRRGAIKQFPDNLFPPMASATDTLKVVVLDHVPRWEEPRRQAFHDWLARGGRLHLFKDASGTYPKFTAGLSDLNAPVDTFRVGAGFVTRQDRPLSEIDEQFVESVLVNNGDSKTISSGKEKAAADKAANRKAGTGKSGQKSAQTKAVQRAMLDDDDEDVTQKILFDDFTGGILSFLRQLTRPRHNWTLIYSMAAVYILAIFPGLYLLGKRLAYYRLVYGALIGLIVLFSLGFAHVGRRGHGEATAVNTLAVARQLPDGALDVTSWTNVFVIAGGDYSISHGGTGRLYSPADSTEPVEGVIHNGVQGRFDVDIPPFSDRPFIHRMKVKQDPFELKVSAFVANTTLKKLILVPGKDFPKPIGPESLYALYRDRIYALNAMAGALEVNASSGQPLSLFFASINSETFSRYANRFNTPFEQSTEGPPQFEKLIRPLIAWTFNCKKRDEIFNSVLPDDRVRLFVTAEVSPAFALQSQQLDVQKGRVVYVIDIPRPVTK